MSRPSLPAWTVAPGVPGAYTGRMATPVPATRRWTRHAYARLVDAGAFHGTAVELLGGQLHVAEPQGSAHATAVGMADDALRAALPPGWILRAQMPVDLDDESVPEPDLAVVAGTRADYRAAHPTRPVLAVEVAESSLELDRHEKGGLYARAGIPDYWIVNLRDGALEVYRDPSEAPEAPFGWRYRTVVTLGRDAVAVPLALPAVRVAVTDLLP